MKKAEKKQLVKKMMKLKDKGINFYYVAKDVATTEGPNTISIFEGITWDQLKILVKRAKEKLKLSNDDCFDFILNKNLIIITDLKDREGLVKKYNLKTTH